MIPTNCTRLRHEHNAITLKISIGKKTRFAPGRKYVSPQNEVSFGVRDAVVEIIHMKVSRKQRSKF